MSSNSAKMQHVGGFLIGKVMIGRISNRAWDGGGLGGEWIVPTPRIAGVGGIRLYLHKDFCAAGIEFYLHKDFRAAEIEFYLHKEFLRKINEYI